MFHISVAIAQHGNRVVTHRNNSCTGFHIICTGVNRNSRLSHPGVEACPWLFPVSSNVFAVAYLL